MHFAQKALTPPAEDTVICPFPEKPRMPVEVRIRKGEPMERALRRLKRKLDREGVIRDARAKRYHEKPSEIKRRKEKVAKFSNYLRLKRERL